MCVQDLANAVREDPDLDVVGARRSVRLRCKGPPKERAPDLPISGVLMQICWRKRIFSCQHML